MNFRLIPVDQLVDDPDVQLEFAFRENWAKVIAENWDERAVGFLVVTPDEEGKTYRVIEGRHRRFAAKLRGIPKVPCEVFPGPLTVAEKAQIKLGRDRQRRRVDAVESFLEEVLAGVPQSVAIAKIVSDEGWEIRKLGGGKPTYGIEAVRPLEEVYRRDPHQLRRLLRLDRIWQGELKANQNAWLVGLGIFVSRDYDQRLTDSGRARLADLAPSKVIKNANTKTGGAPYGASRETGRVIADTLRATAGVRRSREEKERDRLALLGEDVEQEKPKGTP